MKMKAKGAHTAECLYNPLTHNIHTDAASAAEEMILNLQEGYQIAQTNRKMSGEDENWGTGTKKDKERGGKKREMDMGEGV